MQISLLALMIGVLCLSTDAKAKNWVFKAESLGEAGKNIELSLFNQGMQQPGSYPVDIVLNGKKVDSRDIVFSMVKDASGKESLQPCLESSLLSLYGVRVEDFPQLAKEKCAQLNIIPGLTADFQFYSQQLQLNIPQAYLRRKLKGIAPKQLWDDGIPVLLLNYTANTSRTDYPQMQRQHNVSSYVRLNPGANLGAWRLRNQSSWQKSGDNPGKWQNLYTYAERGIYGIHSRLTLGERTTQNDVFDAVPFRGVMLATDEMMLPYNLREFAPVVQGIARTAARLEVKQNGYTIYSDTVAPGPFVLDDLNISGASQGDLLVIVRETDGHTQMFTVPYQTPAIALREGFLKYSLMAGQYRPALSAADNAMMGQATVMYGLPWNLTAYAGLQGAENYQAGSLGLGMSLGDWGAISLDGSGSTSRQPGRDKQQGTVWRLRYDKEVALTGTSLSLSSYQYGSTDYQTIQEVLDSWNQDAEIGNNWKWKPLSRRRSQTNIMLRQSMGRWGSLYLNGSRREYRNSQGRDEHLSAGYSVGLGATTLSLNWSHNRRVDRGGTRRRDDMASLWLSVPLDRLLGGGTMASFQTTSSSQGRTASEVGLNGRAFDQQLYWDVRESYQDGDNVGEHNSNALRLSWNGSYGQAGVGYRYGAQTRQMNADISGGVVIHNGGVTLGQYMNDTVGLVSAPGAAGVSVMNGIGVKTDFRGYTLANNLSAYQENTISLDPRVQSQSAEILQTDMKVVPTKGAVIPVKFSTRVGGRATMTISGRDGQAVPFGSLVMLEGKVNSAGIVGNDGQTYLTGLPAEGILDVKWSNGQCKVTYRLPKNTGPAGLYAMKGNCL